MTRRQGIFILGGEDYVTTKSNEQSDLRQWGENIKSELTKYY